MSARCVGRPLTARASACSSGATRVRASDAAPLPAAAVAALTKLPSRHSKIGCPFRLRKSAWKVLPGFLFAGGKTLDKTACRKMAHSSGKTVTKPDPNLIIASELPLWREPCSFYFLASITVCVRIHDFYKILSREYITIQNSN